jgi:signal transduction histidine kinase
MATSGKRSSSLEKKVEIEEDQVPDPLKIVIYRVIQEAANNIAKHSQANHVHLSIAMRDGRIQLTIQDNGKGFDILGTLAGAEEGRSFGLTSMRERFTRYQPDWLMIRSKLPTTPFRKA